MPAVLPVCMASSAVHTEAEGHISTSSQRRRAKSHGNAVCAMYEQDGSSIDRLDVNDQPRDGCPRDPQSSFLRLCMLPHWLMRWSTRSVSALASTPRATLILGRVCHSFIPTHSFFPATVSGGRGEGVAGQQSDGGQTWRGPQGASLTRAA